MPEELSDGMKADADGFASVLPASLVMPAGAGKTHMLAATAKQIVAHGGKVLVLTHTNAGVHAVNIRLKRFGVTTGAQVSTITSFAFRLARSYPVLGEMYVPKVMAPEDSRKYVQAATRVAAAVHIKAVLAASYTNLLVDEYQDCNTDHHALVLKLKEAIPNIGILGDHLQAIFGFADPLPAWTDVLAEFPEHSAITPEPHRWAGHNEDLGAWLLKVREHLKPGQILNLASANYPTGVQFTNISGNPAGVAGAARAALKLPDDETVLVISARNLQNARSIAADLNGAYTVMEEIAGKFMADWLTKLVATPPSGYAHWLFEFAKRCHSGHGILDPNPLGKRYREGRTGADLLKTSDKRAGAESAIEALDRVVGNPTLAELVAAMDTVPDSAGLQLHSHEAWYDVKTAIRGAIANGNDKNVLLGELAKARDVLRHAGRRERRRIISRTLLVKGLEYDHVIIADAANHLEVNDLYVALTRARKTIHILGTADTITLMPSPVGRDG